MWHLDYGPYGYRCRIYCYHRLKKWYECPHFCILVIGRANAGKTTILEKVCGVAQGTKPIIIKSNPEHKPELKLKSMFTPPASVKNLFNRNPLLSPMPLMPSPAASSSMTHLTPSLEVSCMVKQMDLQSLTCLNIINFRRAYMILRTRLPPLEATLSSMTLRVLKLVQGRRWTLFGNSLRGDLLQLSWEISCMPFDMFLSSSTSLNDLACQRYCIPTEVSCPPAEAELKFFSKERGKGKSHDQLSAIMGCSWALKKSFAYDENIIFIIVLYFLGLLGNYLTKNYLTNLSMMSLQFHLWLFSPNLMAS